VVTIGAENKPQFRWQLITARKVLDLFDEHGHDRYTTEPSRAPFVSNLERFNRERPHQALGLKVPADVYARYRASIAAWRS
jgi:transposase InsO family protein